MNSRAAGLLLCALAACKGYRWGTQETAAELGESPGPLPTVFVEPFDNQTFRRGLEIRLTRLLERELRNRSPQGSVPRSAADWIVQGTIAEARERVLSEDRRDEVRESSVRVRVQVRIVDRTSNSLVRTYSLEETEPFSLRAGRIRNREQAFEQALRDLAERITYGLEAQGPKES